uniref:Olfactory receptor C family, x3 n=1 Tax=Lepisosteus oculatus TaxID=7918 RepID=W5M4S4_LEPOC
YRLLVAAVINLVLEFPALCFKLSVNDMLRMEKGDVVLGGLFPLHYRPAPYLPSFQTEPQSVSYVYFSPRALRWMQTMIFAVEEINKRQDLLPDIKLGYHIMDSCNDIQPSLRSSLVLVNGQPADAGNHTCAGVGRAVSPVIVGDAASGVSMAVLRTLGSFHIPLVSYFASCSCLSNKREFPAFMRTMPSDAYQIKAIAQLVSYFNWTWVGVLGVDNDYAHFAIQHFLEESSRLDVCAAYVHFYPLSPNKKDVIKVINIIKSSSAKVVLNFSGESVLQSILSECRRQNVTDIQWIASEAWATAKSLWKEFHDLLKGTVGFAIRRAEIKDLGDFLGRINPSHARKFAFIAEFWEETFECKLNHSLNTHTHGDAFPRKPCTGRESLERVYSEYSDVSQLRVSYNVYKAVYLIAHALHTLSRCENGSGPFPNQRCVDVRQVLPWQKRIYKQEQVNITIIFPSICFFYLNRWQKEKGSTLCLLKLKFITQVLRTDVRIVIWIVLYFKKKHLKVPRSVCSDSCSPGSRKATRRGQPVCCFDCVPCADGEISSQTDSLDCTKCPLETWSNKARDQCIPKEVEFLSYSESMGMVLTVVSTLGACVTIAVSGVFIFFRNTPIVRANNMELSFLLLLFLILCFLIALTFIGEPTDWSCMVRYTAFGIGFALCISCILAKTVVVLVAFRATLPGSNVMKWFGPTQQRASVFVCTSVQILICIVWLITSPPHAAHNTVYRSAKIILECAVGSVLGFWGVLGYIGLLACLCFFIAFLARKLPDNFNEAKFITFSMLIFFAVWITFVPAYVSTPGKYTVAVQVFAILASAFGLLSCIFAPKCYIILLRPEKN